MKPPVTKLYRIGEIMRYTSLSRQTIHNYTVLGLISEAERTPGNQRLYAEETFARARALGPGPANPLGPSLAAS